MGNRHVSGKSKATIFALPLRSFGEAGMTLVGALVALALVSTVIAMSSIGYKNLNYARRTVEASSAVREADEVIMTAATTTLKKFVRNGCAGSLPTSPIKLGSEFGTMNLSKSVASAFQKDAKLPASFDQAIKRCGGAASGGLYGCFDITKPTGASSNASQSFAGAKAAFIEYFATVHDFKTNQTVSCSAAGSSTTGGLMIYYAIYMIMNSNQGHVYKAKTGVLHSNVL